MQKFMILLLLVGCTKKPAEKQTLPRVHVAEVVEETIPIKIDAVGHFVAYNSAEIKAQVEGQLLKIHFQEGSIVEEGDLLFTIDPRIYEANLEQAVAVFQQSQQNLAYAAEKVGMYKGLLPEQYVSELNFLEYTTESINYEAEVMKTAAALRKAEIQLDYCFIKAPFTGVTSKRLIDIGNLIVNNGNPLLTIKQIDPIFVDFSIPERDFLRLKGSHEVFIQNTPLPGKLTLIGNEIDQKTGMIPLRAQFNNGEHIFWPGQFVRVQILLHEEKALLIPEEAVNIGQKGRYALVISENNIAEYRSIEVGVQVGGRVQIKSGVKKGEKVVTAGQLNVRPNYPVQL